LLDEGDLAGWVIMNTRRTRDGGFGRRESEKDSGRRFSYGVQRRKNILE
jgi:hypothetical protein